MQTAGQYRLEQALSTCEVGEVWSGVDAGGETVTVAVLNERASADDRWRGAFAAAADALAHAADRLPIVDADHAAERPWVACARERGGGAAQIFEALGQRLQVIPEPEPEPEPEPVAPISVAPVSAAPVSAAPVSAAPVSAAPVSASPFTASPFAVPSVTPSAHEPFVPLSVPAEPAPTPIFAPKPELDGSPAPGVPRVTPTRKEARAQKATKNTNLLIAAAAVAGLVIGSGGTAAAMSLGGSDDGPGAAAALTDAQLLVQGTPAAPGIEPPVGGGWPANAPTFASNQPTVPMTALEGLGFDFRVPQGWTCDLVEKAEAAVRYQCAGGDGASSGAGGELIVRTCDVVCDETRRTAMRQKEEAWGLQWVRSGPFATWAETSGITGERQYGLVYVGFWRSVPEGGLDRELVLRMTAPLTGADDLKRVVNSIRDETFTL
ncbi:MULTISPECIES: hypothetical protein [Actinoplanes]|uniref:hypothetical protein n=1 Tax=Actinoplanes TaxID=1865 RepID=UPI0005F27D10|nr:MULTISPECIES: hypothetical protein [Actinoplanes]GLY01615.1 hypothetical protein Acsp01_19940 [Actinoplanes sp. NBRC 101535]